MAFTTIFKDLTGASFEDVTVERFYYDPSEATREGLVANKAVRRPMRGFVLSKETYASISVLTPSLVNSSLRSNAGPHFYTTNFLLQSVTETRNEKVQYVSTFGSTYAFFFGEQPRIINCAAVLLNSPDFNWEKEWWVNYENVLRGTSLTSMNSKAILEYDGLTITGYLTNCTTIKNAADPRLVNVNFSMFIESIDYGSDVGSDSPYGRQEETAAEFLGVAGPFDKEGRVLEESTTAAVRRANIKLAGTGPSGLMGALSALDGAIDGAIRKARNFLYGRNMVVSRSFVSERANTPIFPQGTGAEGLEGFEVAGGGLFGQKSVLSFSENPAPGSSSVTLRLNADGFIPQESLMEDRRTSNRTWDNFDEYVNAPALTTNSFTVGQSLGVTAALKSREAETLAANAQLNADAVAAYAAFGLNKAVEPYVAGADSRDSTAALVQYQTAAGKQKVATVVRSLARVAFGAATFAVGTSIVNSKRELQATITNPNSGGLDAGTIAELNAEMEATKRTTEQERLVAEAEADELRGNTGTTYNLAEAILSTIL